ncbi:hypothetical protein KP509_10G070000 [Ceratopteris richardii]|uniref:Methyltransferase FkbM domain-containing protein n=1 Tax=Ceratopteris richardii TaxID=49495 RepID=A0A8T2TYI7_CERRI|nr:hypothetical protein KP509_10G070000 [Ceratopteris richardii]
MSSMGVIGELCSANKKLHVRLLYCVMAAQFIYIAVDHFVYHNRIEDPLLGCACEYCPGPVAWATARARLETAIAESYAEERKPCKLREDYYDESEDEENEAGSGEQLVQVMKRKSTEQQDAWRQMKWVGQPAACPVRGKVIEKLDIQKNFRRGYALRFVDDVEDKTHLLPWLLGSQIDLNRRHRRVYIDLGANRFRTSVEWFLRMYPCDFTEVHAFEVNRRSWRPPRSAFDEVSNSMPGSNDSLLVRKKAGIAEWMLQRVHVYYKRASHMDDEAGGLVNITRFVKEELGLRREDAVVVKMDIEGNEWSLLKAWMEDPDMPLIVDELFVEVHYAHPSMRAFGWDEFSPITRQDARRLLGDLRWKGFYVHAWP